MLFRLFSLSTKSFTPNNELKSPRSFENLRMHCSGVTLFIIIPLQNLAQSVIVVLTFGIKGRMKDETLSRALMMHAKLFFCSVYISLHNKCRGSTDGMQEIATCSTRKA